MKRLPYAGKEARKGQVIKAGRPQVLSIAVLDVLDGELTTSDVHYKVRAKGLPSSRNAVGTTLARLAKEGRATLVDRIHGLVIWGPVR